MDKFVLFWCLIIIAMTFFLIGFYKNVVVKITRILCSISDIHNGGALSWSEQLRYLFPNRRGIVDEAVVQRRIRQRSRFLWSRHALVCYGFIVLFVFDLFWMFAGHYAHHYFHIKYFLTGLGRGLLKIGFELSGATLLAGLTLSMITRLIHTRPARRYVVDFALLSLLWLVTVTGFANEALRLVTEPMDPLISFSFIAAPLAKMLMKVPANWAVLSQWMWLFHAIITATFVAYIPFSKFVHVFVTPFGRSITQDDDAIHKQEKIIREGLI